MSTDPHATGRDLGLLERLHPAITAGVAAAAIGLCTLGYLVWRGVSATEPSVAAGSSTAPSTAPRSSSPSPSPSPTGVALSTGAWSLESADQSGSYVRREDDRARIGTVSAESDASDRREASLVVLAGLADASCFTFRASDGRYLRHYDFRLRFDEPDDTALFREDATFCAGTGATAESVTLRSRNYPDRVIHRRQTELWLDRPDGSEGFAAASSFIVRPSLAS